LTEVISIKFRGRGKSYYFDPAGVTAVPGDKLVVETSKGMELGDCCEGNHTVDDSRLVLPLRPVIRKATRDDLRVADINREREKEAMAICAEKIEKHGLEMKLVDVECSFEGNKILFFFTADGRVDFRELVKDLAGVFRTRIELRQIGVRDEAKMLGGLGICGRPFCCSQFLEDFQPVSTKMAKTQSMSLNPAKISGTCGRLMCCLRYEQEAYEDLIRHVPKNGAFVETTEGYGNVVQVNLLRQQVKVRLDGAADGAVSTFAADEVAEVPGGRPPEGVQPPRVLCVKPKVKEEPPVRESWTMPRLFADLAEEIPETPVPAPAETAEAPRKDHPRRRRHKSHAGGDKAAAKADKPAENKPKADKQPAANKGQKAGRKGAKAPAKAPKAEKPAEKTPEKPAGEAQAKKPHHHRRRHYKPRPKTDGT